MDGLSFLSGGQISRSRFVKASTVGTQGVVVQVTSATADRPIGISQEGQWAPPGVIDFYAGAGTDSQYAASASGQPIRVYGDGEVCQLEMGATCNFGDPLIPDANGRGTPWSATGGVQYPGAVAAEACSASGQRIRVKVELAAAARGSG